MWTSSATSPPSSLSRTSATALAAGRWRSRRCANSHSTGFRPTCPGRPAAGSRPCATGSSPMHRLFVAIRPPEPIRDLLVDAMDDSPDFRWQDDEQLHLTLRFSGEVDRPMANDLADALGRIRAAPFELRIAGAGRFEQRNSGALWAGVEPKEPVAALAAKVERVCQQVGLEPERRAFHPHITL